MSGTGPDRAGRRPGGRVWCPGGTAVEGGPVALKTLRFVAIVCASLALGLTVAHVLERPGKAQLSGAERLAEVLGLAG